MNKNLTVEEMKKELAQKHNVKEEFLDYIGSNPVPYTKKIVHNFNILDPKHPSYKSTVVVIEG